jgi:uncharacterized protein
VPRRLGRSVSSSTANGALRGVSPISRSALVPRGDPLPNSTLGTIVGRRRVKSHVRFGVRIGRCGGAVNLIVQLLLRSMLNRKLNAWLFVVSVILLVAGIGGLYVAGSSLIAPNPSYVGELPDDLVGETVHIESASGSTLAGWFLPSQRSDRAVVLLHGAHASRMAMLERARLFSAAGYAVLLIDFQSGGESPGEAITYGFLERHDAIAAVVYLRRRMPQARVGVIGVSMGGAAAVLAGNQLNADAVVLEAVYSTLSQAVSNRLTMRFGPWAAALTPLLTAQTRLRLGFSVDDLQPLSTIRDINAPVFIISGAQDLHTTLDETESMAAAAAEPKRLWVIRNAAHIDLYAHAGPEYAGQVLGFFDQYLSH